ncbi:MAG: mitochondrial splicing system protein [Sclerophora amabilis]|nr:MAG: mitochondrial splicing system protein [Sclerophora amabilis]
MGTTEARRNRIYSALCPKGSLPKPRCATLRKLYEPHTPNTTSTIIDSGALILFFPAPHTVTGEDVLELHTHGGTAVTRAVLGAISRCAPPPLHLNSSRHQIRYAEPGEFTRRAFLNGRLDLTQIEALGDTLDATTEQQRLLAVRGTTNELSKRYETWRQQLLYARGELEALIDFSEDQHFDESPATLASSVAAQVERLRGQMRAHSENAVRGELLRNGIGISLLGAPNAGKSSLLNRIVGREAAIVNKEEGTTRDIVEVGVDLGGWYCRLGDMAGLRGAQKASDHVLEGNDAGVTVGEIEREGVTRAIERALSSDVLIIVLSVEHASQIGTDAEIRPSEPELRLDPSVLATAAQYSSITNNKGAIVVVVNKIDNLPLDPSSNAEIGPATLPQQYIQTLTSAMPFLDPSRIFGISCKSAASPSASKFSKPTPTSSVSAGQSPSPDPGNIQAFVRGLIQVFHQMTSPITPEQHFSDPSNLNHNYRESPQTSPSLEPQISDRSIYESSLGASERQRLLLEECTAHLDSFLLGVVRPVHPSRTSFGKEGPVGDGDNDDETEDREEIDIVVLAEELRAAAGCLARITGRGQDAGDVEEVLGVVFEK